MADKEPEVMPIGPDGEPMSKNAYKKMKKAEEAAAKKAEKDAAKAAAKALAGPTKEKIGGENDEELDPTKYFENRVSAMEKFKENGGDVFPHKFHCSLRISEFIEKYSALEDGQHLEEVVSIAGRILSKRIQGKLLFYDVHGENTKIQIMSDISNYEGGEDAFRAIHAMVKRGDIVGVRGVPGKSKNGELSIFPKEMTMLSPCFHMIPKVSLLFKI